MTADEGTIISNRIERIRYLIGVKGVVECFEAASLAQVVLHGTVGGHHPLMANIQSAVEKADYHIAMATSRAVVALYDDGGLESPRLAIAHEIEGDILDIAQSQLEAADLNKDSAQKQLQLAVAAFLSGASLEDALRRICDVRSISYDAQRSSLAKLQEALYQPSKKIEVISSS